MSDAQDSTSSPYVNPHQGDAWASDAAAQGKTGTQRLLAVEHGPPPPDVQQALELGPGEQVVVRRRLILADDQPVELAESYYPASIAVGTPLAEHKKIKGGAVRVLVDAGHPLEDITDTITARLPDAEEELLLDVAAEEPLIVISRVSCPQGQPPAEYAVNRMVASRIPPLQYRMRNTAQ
jgi:DNA-binding GntR family transcriptional regulator